jgi:hypothetical protein
MKSTAIHDVVIRVTSPAGGFQVITFDVGWTKSGEPAAVNSTDDGHTVTQLIPTTIDATASMLISGPTGPVTFTFGTDSVTTWSLERVLVDTN